VHGDVLGRVAFDLVLGIILARVMRISFVVDVFRVNLDDLAADSTSFGIPANVVAHFESGRHDELLGATRSSSSPDGRIAQPGD
jgi:hypothetical protein